MGPGSPPADAEVERLLSAGGLAYRSGRLGEARAAYEAAAAKAPDDHRAHHSLASIEVREGRLGAARDRLARVVRLAPDGAAGWRNLAGVCRELGLLNDSAQALRRLVSLAPHDPEPRFALAGDLFALGRGAAAQKAWRELTLAPGQRLRALSRLAIADATWVTPDEIDEMSAAEASEDLAIALAFAVGGAREAQGRFADAFAAFERGNRMQRAVFLRAAPGRRPPDILAANLEAARRVQTLIPRKRLAAAGEGLRGPAPIFVVGLPRSGSSLTERILGAHREVQALGETGLLPRLLERAYPSEPGGPFARPLADLGQAYLEGLRERGWDGARRPLDKTLENRLHVGAIRLMFPDAVILESRRSPLETCLGCWRQLFAQGGETLCDFADIAAEHRAAAGLMEHWRRAGAGVTAVSLEGIVADPGAAIRSLVTQNAGLSWDPACERFWEGEGMVRTASAGQARRPVSGVGLARARAYAAWIGPLAEALEVPVP